MKIIVTGATKGIGRAIVEKFAAEGFDVALCARTEADLLSFRQELTEKYPGREVLVRATNMSKKEEAVAFAGFVKQKWKEVDVVVNNAGIFLPGEIHKEAEGILEEVMAANLYSAYHFTRAILPVMLERREGHIFNMCSIASLFAYPDGGSYSISKFALLGFSKVLREELKERGIKVTAVLPGATWTPSWSASSFKEDRFMKASDVALAVWSAWQMSPSAVVEEILMRPQLGDL